MRGDRTSDEVRASRERRPPPPDCRRATPPDAFQSRLPSKPTTLVKPAGSQYQNNNIGFISSCTNLESSTDTVKTLHFPERATPERLGTVTNLIDGRRRGHNIQPLRRHPVPV